MESLTLDENGKLQVTPVNAELGEKIIAPENMDEPHQILVGQMGLSEEDFQALVESQPAPMFQPAPKYSIVKTPNGEQLTVVDTRQDIFNGKPQKDYAKIARREILNHFKGQILPLGENDLARITDKTAREYAYPHNQPKGILDTAKMKASTELDNLLKAAKYVSSATDTKNHKEATLGFDYYETKFVVDGHVFKGLLNVATSDNGRILYDVTKITEIPDTSGKYATLMAQSTSAFGDLNGKSISQTDSNNKYTQKNNLNSSKKVNYPAPFGVDPVEWEIRVRKAKKAKTLLGITAALYNVDERTYAAAESLARETGARIVFDGTLGPNQEGYYQNGMIHLNPRVEGNFAVVFAHELTHHLEGTSAYQELFSYVLSLYGDENAQQKAIAKKITEYSIFSEEQLELTVQEARTELVAEFIAKNLFSNQTEVLRLANFDLNLAEKIKAFLSRLAAKVTGNKERQFLLNAERLYTMAIDEARGGGNAPLQMWESGGKQYSIKRTSKMTLAKQLKLFYDGKMERSDAFYFGSTPENLSVAGIEPLPLAFTITAFQKSTREKHNVPRRVLKALNRDLAQALFTFSDGDRVGIMTAADIDGDGKPLLIAIQKNVTMDADRVNAIRSVYGLDHPAAWVQNQIDSGKVFTLLDEERANAVLYPYGYLASRKDGIHSLDDTVAQGNRDVKGRISQKEDTAQSSKEAPAFLEAFCDPETGEFEGTYPIKPVSQLIDEIPEEEINFSLNYQKILSMRDPLEQTAALHRVKSWEKNLARRIREEYGHPVIYDAKMSGSMATIDPDGVIHLNPRISGAEALEWEVREAVKTFEGSKPSAYAKNAASLSEHIKSQEWQEKYVDNPGKSAKIDLTEDEYGALNAYISSDSYKLNERLRRGEKPSKAEEHFMKALDSALDKMPEKKGVVYRSITADDVYDVSEIISTYHISQPISFQAYTSASLEVYDHTMEIQYIITSKHGKDISQFNNREKEILFKRGTYFVPTKIEGSTIYLEEI